MKKYIAILWMTVAVALNMSAQSVDEKIGNAMNASDWFALDSIYRVTPKESINPFLEVLSRCLIGNRLNRTEMSIAAFQELFNTQSENLGLENLISSAHMFGMDLSRMGYNAEAASMINSILEATRQYLDSTNVAALTISANRYKALSSYRPYRIEFPDCAEATVPFTIVPVGPADKGSVLMHLQDSQINGIDADITLDTGAGTNLISVEMAEKFNLIPLDNATITVVGVNSRNGSTAIAKELKIGNITLSDVPFTVISLSSDNKEADQYIDCFNIVIGSELMLQLKDLMIDFAKHQITIPTTPPAETDCYPNICFSSSMNLMTKGSVLNNPMLMCIDSGDASFGTLGKTFFDKYKDFITSHARPDSIREAGIGGVIISECYKVPDIPVSIGGNTVFPSELTVKLANGAMRGDYECNIGVKTLMLYQKIRFNLVDFVLTTEPAVSLVSVNTSGMSVPDFKFKKPNGPNPLQALGIIGIGVVRGLINPNAPDNPDL